MRRADADKIQRLRSQGFGPTKIAATVGLPVNTVKSYCYRHPLSVATPEWPEGCCKQCGVPIEQKPKQKPRLFCSDECRQTWWNAHRGLVIQRTAVTKLCAYCGKPFKSYEKQHRKYCCHRCYEYSRFKGDLAYDQRAV